MRLITFKTIYKSEILIYQMGKVASTSIKNGLNSIGISNYHFHNMIKSNLLQNEELTLKAALYFSFKNFWYYIIIRVYIFLSYLLGKEIKIITMVREPVIRNISMFFHQIEKVLYDFLCNLPDDKETIRRKHLTELEVLTESFENNFNHKQPLEWFDNEIKKFFGIDVFKYEFDKESGYCIIKEKNISILILKVEKLGNNENIIRQFINNEEFKLTKVNIGKNQWFSKMRKEFMNNFAHSDKYVDMLYKTKFINHFYTQNEIEKFKNKWKKKR